jgi:hypothetical protein
MSFIMLTAKNRITEAREDTLVNKAENESLESLSLLYSLPWVREISFLRQQDFLKTVLYSVRGTFTGFFSAVRSFYYDREIAKSGAVLAGGGLTTLPRITHADITAGYHERFIEFNDGSTKRIYYIMHAVTGHVYLCPVRSKYTSKPPTTGFISGSFRLLPWIMHERQHAKRNLILGSNLKRPCEVILELDSDLYDNPYSYLRENGNVRTNDPYGAHLLSLFDNDPATPSNGNQTTGPYPLYFAGGGAGGMTTALLKDLLASGIKLSINSKKYDNSPF